MKTQNTQIQKKKKKRKEVLIDKVLEYFSEKKNCFQKAEQKDYYKVI